MLYSECRPKKATELRICSVKLKGPLLSHSAVSVAALAKAAILSCYLYCLAINLARLLLND